MFPVRLNKVTLLIALLFVLLAVTHGFGYWIPIMKRQRTIRRPHKQESHGWGWKPVHHGWGWKPVKHGWGWKPEHNGWGGKSAHNGWGWKSAQNGWGWKPAENGWGWKGGW